jgi:hypothetical protein
VVARCCDERLGLSLVWRVEPGVMRIVGCMMVRMRA